MIPPHFYIFMIIYLPFEEDLAIYLNKLNFPLSKDNLYQVWLNLIRWFWRRIVLEIFIAFLLFHYYLHLKKDYPFIWTNLNPLQPRMICVKSG
jgi:hypothetical protein